MLSHMKQQSSVTNSSNKRQLIIDDARARGFELSKDGQRWVPIQEISAKPNSFGANIEERRSRTKFAIFSVLIIGVVGTAGFFVYDYLTEPEFFGEIYWNVSGIGIMFEEESVYLVTAPYNVELLDQYICVFDSRVSGADDFEKDGVCYWETSPDNYTIKSVNGGDYFSVCSTSAIFGDEHCSKIHPIEGGIILEIEGNCSVSVGDINPPEDYQLWLSAYAEYNDWQQEVIRIAEELKEEVPSNCNYIPMGPL